MLIFSLERVMALRGINKPFAFLTKRGFYRTIASNLVNSCFVHIKIAHLETLCRALNCTPNDLFEWKDDGQNTLNENHPLNSLRRTKTAAQIKKIVNEIPIDKLERVEEMLNQMKNEE